MLKPARYFTTILRTEEAASVIYVVNKTHRKLAAVRDLEPKTGHKVRNTTMMLISLRDIV